MIIKLKDCSTKRIAGWERVICPDCKTHTQHNKADGNRCDNIIYKDELKDGKLEVYGRCQCYSKDYHVEEN